MYWLGHFTVRDDITAELRWGHLLEQADVSDFQVDESEYHLSMEMEQESKYAELLRVPVALLRDRVIGAATESDESSPRIGSIAATAPFPSQTTRISLGRGATNLWTMQVHKEPPIIKLDDKIEISPERGRQVIRWFSETSSSCSPKYKLFLEAAELGRVPLTGVLEATEIVIDFRALPGCQSGHLVVQVCDGLYVSESVSDSFDLKDVEPLVLITYPPDDARLSSRQPVQFCGQAMDRQTRQQIPTEDLKWTIDTRAIGTGRVCVPTLLERGEHSIKLSVTSSKGLTGESTIRVVVS